jgi:hypothetical protein
MGVSAHEGYMLSGIRCSLVTEEDDSAASHAAQIANMWYYKASPLFLGDKSAYYGGELRYMIRHSIAQRDPWHERDGVKIDGYKDVILVGGPQHSTLTLWLSYNTGNIWRPLWVVSPPPGCIPATRQWERVVVPLYNPQGCLSYPGCNQDFPVVDEYNCWMVDDRPAAEWEIEYVLADLKHLYIRGKFVYYDWYWVYTYGYLDEVWMQRPSQSPP